MVDRNRRVGYRRYNPYTNSAPKPEFKILTKVQSQLGFRGRLILLQTVGFSDSNFTTIQNGIDYIGSRMKVVKLSTSEPLTDIGKYKYCLYIDDEPITEGQYTSESTAKKELADIAIKDLQNTCFTIIRKIHPRSSPQVNFSPSTAGAQENQSAVGENIRIPETPLKGGIGERMMKGMGWSGGGLGAQEQGRIDIVHNYIQIDRQGLGSKNIVQEVTKILQKHADSKSINSIAFSTDFSKEERSIIHQVARKLNLKSKSYGQADDRILVIQSKMRLIDLVRSLLETGGQNEQYQLLLPAAFQNL